MHTETHIQICSHMKKKALSDTKTNYNLTTATRIKGK